MHGDYHKLLPTDRMVTKIGHPRCDSQSLENGQELQKELLRNIQITRKLNKYF